MPSIKNLAHNLRREESEPQQSGRVGTVDILAASDEFEASASARQKFVAEVEGFDQQLE